MSEEELFANVELNETTMSKAIAYLVIQVSELKKENKDNINRIHELEQKIDNEYVDKVKYKTKYNKYKEVLDKIKEKCLSIKGNPEHTIVSKNELVKQFLELLEEIE